MMATGITNYYNRRASLSSSDYSSEFGSELSGTNLATLNRYHQTQSSLHQLHHSPRGESSNLSVLDDFKTQPILPTPHSANNPGALYTARDASESSDTTGTGSSAAPVKGVTGGDAGALGGEGGGLGGLLGGDDNLSLLGEVDACSIRSSSHNRPFARGRRASMADIDRSDDLNGGGFYANIVHKKESSNTESTSTPTKAQQRKAKNRGRRNSLFGGYLGSSKASGGSSKTANSNVSTTAKEEVQKQQQEEQTLQQEHAQPKRRGGKRPSNRRASMGSVAVPHRKDKVADGGHGEASEATPPTRQTPQRTKSSDEIRITNRSKYNRRASNDGAYGITYHRPKHSAAFGRRRASLSATPQSYSQFQAQQQAQQQYEQQLTKHVPSTTAALDGILPFGLNRHHSPDAAKATAYGYNQQQPANIYLPKETSNSIAKSNDFDLNDPTLKESLISYVTDDESEQESITEHSDDFLAANHSGPPNDSFVLHGEGSTYQSTLPHQSNNLEDLIKPGRATRAAEEITLEEGIHAKTIAPDILDEIDGLPAAPSKSIGAIAQRTPKQISPQQTRRNSIASDSLRFQGEGRPQRRASYIPSNIFSADLLLDGDNTETEGEDDLFGVNSNVDKKSSKSSDTMLHRNKRKLNDRTARDEAKVSEQEPSNDGSIDNEVDEHPIGDPTKSGRSFFSHQSSATKIISNRKEFDITQSMPINGPPAFYITMNSPIEGKHNEPANGPPPSYGLQSEDPVNGAPPFYSDDQKVANRQAKDPNQKDHLVGDEVDDEEDEYRYEMPLFQNQAVTAKGDWGCGLSEELSDLPGRQRINSRNYLDTVQKQPQQELMYPDEELDEYCEEFLNYYAGDDEDETTDYTESRYSDYDNAMQEAEPRSMSSMEFINMATLSKVKKAQGLFLPNFVPASSCTNASDFIVRCFVARMRLGMVVTKHSKNRFVASHDKVLLIRPDGFNLTWVATDDEKESEKRGSIHGIRANKPPPNMDLSKCIEVRHAWSKDTRHPKYTGTPTLRAKCKDGTAKQSFALIFRERTVDFTAQTYDQCTILMEGFSALCFRLQMAQLEAKEQNSFSKCDGETDTNPSNDQDCLSATASLTGTNVTAPWGY